MWIPLDKFPDHSISVDDVIPDDKRPSKLLINSNLISSPSGSIEDVPSSLTKLEDVLFILVICKLAVGISLIKTISNDHCLLGLIPSDAYTVIVNWLGAPMNELMISSGQDGSLSVNTSEYSRYETSIQHHKSSPSGS